MVFPDAVVEDTSKGLHCRLRKVYTGSTDCSQKKTTIVISANFIIN